MSVTVAERLCQLCGKAHPLHQKNRLYTCRACMVQWTSCDPHCWFCQTDVLDGSLPATAGESAVKLGPWFSSDGVRVRHDG